MYRLREMTMNDKVCEQVNVGMLQEVYPKEVIERCVQSSEPWGTEKATCALEHGLESRAVCDRDGAVEPAQPVPGVEQPGRHAQ